jgi:hypothetical protein
MEELSTLERIASRAGGRVISHRTIDGAAGPVLATLIVVRDGWHAAQVLQDLSDEDARDPRVIALAQSIARENGHDLGKIHRAIHGFVQSRIAFVPEDPERFQHSMVTLAAGFGDCDDHARMVYALGKAAGCRVRLAFLRELGQPSHVFAAFWDGGLWTPAETTIAAYYGEPPKEAARRLRVPGRPDLEGDPVSLDRRPIRIATMGQIGDVPEAFGTDETAARPGAFAENVKGPWSQDPARTQRARELFVAVAPWDISEPEVHAALAISAIETGIGGGLHNNFGALMCGAGQVPHDPASSPVKGSCPAGCQLTTDVTAQDGVRRWVCMQDYPTAAAGALAFLTLLRRRIPNSLGSGDARLIASEMYEAGYYGGATKSAAVNVNAYAAALEGASSVIARHLGSSVLVARRFSFFGLIIAGTIVSGLTFAIVQVIRRERKARAA